MLWSWTLEGVAAKPEALEQLEERLLEFPLGSKQWGPAVFGSKQCDLKRVTVVLVLLY